ncbi:nucleotide-binding universal stress UspA family protein [Comamonas odontotermitis]|uniref:Nucleotide-binding universal stress UspA family protein n=1 Tax=Comamonas odontotermitis TaxID=379895 RepID=A0ABR6RK40_9BURK|nr:universal stress protein [Comamonas odontotermitis]MBB6579511.1 nucleotide-binding universal stress UspA family protein [Comamonas odontotermitis]
MYQKILLAMDDGHASELALSQAIILAKATGSEVKVLFVASGETGGLMAHIDASAGIPQIPGSGQRTLADAAKLLEAAGIVHVTQLNERNISPIQIHEVIVAEADAWGADLLVLGTHGRRGVSRMIMGSVSEGVISKTTKPVLLVRSALED